MVGRSFARYVAQSVGIVWLLVLGVGCQTQPPAPPSLALASAETVQNSISCLASDEMDGRGLGTPGLNASASYIAGYYRGLGLLPPRGQKDYFQPFAFSTLQGFAPTTAFSVGSKEYKLGDDFNPPAFSAEGRFDAPVVFVGYGITAKDKSGYEYDDYAGVDVRGKVAMAMRYEPHTADGQSRLAERDWSENARLARKAKLAAEHGAVALLLVHPPVHHPDETYALPVVPMARMPTEQSPIPVIQVKMRVADEMLRQAGAPDLKTFQNAIDWQFAPRSFVMGNVRARGTVGFERTTYELKNVMAYLPGRGWRSDEYILIGAHYDHLGRGNFASRALGSNAVHPGADDNASGTAAAMELARIFSQARPKLGRSLLFVNFSAEEEGLIGSRYFVEHPPVPLNKIVAMVNLDMVGRLRLEQLLIGGIDTTACFREILDQADQSLPLKLKESFVNGVAPSDNASFVIQRIPSLFLWTNEHEDYHRPTDTPDKINSGGEARVIDFVVKVIANIARTPKMPFVESKATTAPWPQAGF